MHPCHVHILFSVPSFRSHRSFVTLMECLVVFFILSLLISLLLPALHSSVETSQSSCCLGHLRQLGQAFMQYSEDHNDYFPEGNSRQPVLEHGGTNWSRYMLPYFQDPHILDCPTSPDPAPEASCRALHFYDGNYGWNFDGTQGKYGPWSQSIKDPSRVYLLFDSGDQCITYWSNTWECLMEELDLDWNSGKEGCNRHRGKVNAIFLDTHAEARPLDTFLAVPNSSLHFPWHIQWKDPILEADSVPFPNR